ncbi:C40 family peptidase [Aquibaculum arenosum]|uniref:NlpC/P60 family protein n=1 Tax=Aquibaculum arenosum TaxID=3032591 RepID=A0ABT5YQR1_9PROT|nr:NlpC/P60 family protein [Fodinicurvata sp. CAU 1616]MDF2097320.1 NlpC/P60 family protein [Fodinicurvata sp. CAU 1616]
MNVTTQGDLAAAIVAEARGWIGVRYRHQGRLKASGVDCVGLAVGVARELGLAVADRLDYPRRPDPETLRAGLAEQLLEIDPAAALPGDLLRLAPGGKATHVGICSRLADGRPGLIHAYAPCRRVVEHGWDGRWPGLAVDAWRWPPLCLPGE